MEISNDLSNQRVDILENHLFKLDSDILQILLSDKTTKTNIIWGTDNYSKYGLDYECSMPIRIWLITGKNGHIIKPRTKKSNIEKKNRIKEKAEVFTHAWICNRQNNSVDNLWFEEENLFNYENNDSWTTNKNKVPFKKKHWKDYVLDLRMEITCGEAPYIASRYDTVSGEIIPPEDRIGILDRKIRIVNENVSNDDEWYEWVKKSFQSVYGFEWQGDSLLIARENLLFTFIDYYTQRFFVTPDNDKLKEISDIIAWNFWQMDGKKCVVPLSCKNDDTLFNLLGEPVKGFCPGCKKNLLHAHNGIYCLIKDWQKNETPRFVDIVSMRNKT